MRLLGEGGMGAVYQAWDLRLQGHVIAVKENFDNTPAAQTQFQVEAALLAKLNHPALPRVTDYFIEASGRQYLVMDFVEGNDLEKHIAQYGRVPETQAVTWITEILNALEYLHTQRPPIIHRDIKPANIKIRPDGKAMLVDFGIAKAYDPTIKTQTGARAVTPGYAPLEQYGRGTTEPRSDLYAVGATLYFMLTTQIPPEATDIATGVHRLTSLSAQSVRVNPNVERAIMRAMMLDANQRFQSAREFRDALNVKATPQYTPSPTNVYAPPMSPSPNPQLAPTLIPQAQSLQINQPRTPRMPNATPMANLQYASWGRRATAYIIDWILFYIVSLPFSFTAQVMDSAISSSSSNPSQVFLLLWNCCQILIIPAYYVICYTLWGKTIGKKIVGIQVVRIVNHRPPTIGWAIIRTIAYEVESFLCLLLIGFVGFLYPLWDNQKQALHDKIAGTIVIRV